MKKKTLTRIKILYNIYICSDRWRKYFMLFHNECVRSWNENVRQTDSSLIFERGNHEFWKQKKNEIFFRVLFGHFHKKKNGKFVRCGEFEEKEFQAKMNGVWKKNHFRFSRFSLFFFARKMHRNHFWSDFDAVWNAKLFFFLDSRNFKSNRWKSCLTIFFNLIISSQ